MAEESESERDAIMRLIEVWKRKAETYSPPYGVVSAISLAYSQCARELEEAMNTQGRKQE